MSGTEELGDMGDAVRSVAAQAQELWERFAEEVDLERRMRETPMTVLAVAAATGFVLGGGLWPVLRPFVKAAARAAAALGAALGALRASGAGVGAGEVATAPPAGGSGAH
jgi:hypothetical protein